MSPEEIAALPKAELHCHLEACVRPGTLREVATALGREVPADEAAFRREWLLTEPLQDLETALRAFANIQSVWANEEIIERLAYEAVEYAADQGIRIFELRYSPDFIAAAHPHLDFERIHRAIVAGLERARNLPVATGLIGIIQKTLSDVRAAYTADFIVECSDTFVGLDMADHDDGNQARFLPLVEKARVAGLHFTTHAGEEPTPDAAQQVRDAIEVLGAERIGHGIHIVRDPAVMEFVIERDVLLEVCPTSNWLTSAVPSTAEHPIRRLMEAGVPVSINSDDPGLFGIDLCHEYRILAEEQDYTRAEFERLNDLAAAKSFIPEAEKARVWPRPINQGRRAFRPDSSTPDSSRPDREGNRA
ncbi:adenosine deaminase [Lentisalinibacter salinarum]|uniref:adenosine deaminase n=1 Tax=Lentisalinibacter salinarum TaxID=2992239 RepID=UPI003863ED73